MKSSTNDIREINVKDLLGYICSWWKMILICLIICSIIAGAYCLISGYRAETKVITQEEIDATKEKLSPEQIDQVDYLYTQYLSYKAYRKSIQEYMADSLYSFEDCEDNTIMTTLYYVESEIENANQIFTRLSVGTKEYEEIAEVLGKDRTMLDDIYRRVSISDVSANVANSGTSNIIIQENEKNELQNSILQVWVVAPSEEKADEVTDVIERSFEKRLETLRKIDSNINFTVIDKQYSSNIQGFLNSRQSDAINNLNNANNQLNALQTNYVDKLDSDEKAYYEIMKERDEQEITPIKKPSLKKYLVIGAALGIIIAAVIIVLIYIFNGRVKTSGYISRRYEVDAPYAIYRRKKAFRVFGSWIRKLRGIALSDEAIRQQMVSSDIGIKLEKLEKSSAYMLCDEVTDWEKETALQLKDSLSKRGKAIDLTVGNPLTDPAELEKFSQADAVLIMAQLDETKEQIVDKWMQLANRYDLNVIGAVILQEC